MRLAATDVRTLMMFGHLKNVVQARKVEALEMLPWLRSSLLHGFQDLLVMKVAIARISTEDFDGHNLLFKDAKARLEEKHSAFGLLCQAFNLLAVEQKELPIDLDLVRSVLENDVTELISRWRDLARLGMCSTGSANAVHFESRHRRP